jgi:predicted TIM-barrel fold metal-dependent hydrolase
MNRIVDAHMHVFREQSWNPSDRTGKVDSWMRQVRWFEQSVEAAQQRYVSSVEKSWDPNGELTIKRMDEAGVDVSVMMPMDRGFGHEDDSYVPIAKKNEGCYELAQLWPGRLFSFCGVDPRRPEAAELLRRGLTEWGMLGLKLYPTTGFYPDDEVVYPLYEICAEHGVPVLLHQGHSGGRLKSKYGHPMYVDSAAADFPAVNFVLGHGARAETWGHEALSVAIYKSNVYIDMSLWQHWMSVDDLVKKVTWIRDRIGIERLLFASDMTNVEVSLTLQEWVGTIKMLPEWAKQLGYRLSSDEIALVLGGNAERLYRLPS